MSDINYHIYMQGADKNGEPLPNEPIMDLESDFVGLKYSSAKGINDIGKAKNIYVENFAESEKSRVLVPDNITNEPTTITLTLYFLGENRQKVFDAFNEYVRKGFHNFWDDVRNKSFTFYVIDSIPASDEKFVGSEPYIEGVYKLKNIKGHALDVNGCSCGC